MLVVYRVSMRDDLSRRTSLSTRASQSRRCVLFKMFSNIALIIAVTTLVLYSRGYNVLPGGATPPTVLLNYQSVTSHSIAVRAQRAPPAPDAIAGVYVAFRRPKPFLTAALAFRDAYPETSFYIVCDSGCYDYRMVAAGLGAVFIGPRALTIKNGRMFLGPAEAMALFATWREVLETATEEWFMTLEDDVRVIKRVDTKTLKSDINGAVTFAVLSPELENWILKRNPNPIGRQVNDGNLYLGGMGGNIYRSSFWRERLASPTLLDDITNLITETNVRAVDHLCSALTYAWNGTVGFYDGYGGGWSENMGKRWFDEQLSVVHDDKSTYQLNLTALDLEALGPNWATPLVLPGTPETDWNKT